MSKNVEARIDNRREWGQSKAAVNCSDLIQRRREDGALDRATQGEVVWDRRKGEGVFLGAQFINRAAENHRGDGEAPFMPSLKAAGKGSNALESLAA